MATDQLSLQGDAPLELITSAQAKAESTGYQTTVHSWLQENLHKGTHASSELARGSRVNDWRFLSNHISDV